MGNRGRHRKRRRASLKKETIRTLDLPALSPEDLARAAGGALKIIAYKAPYTTACITDC